MKRTSVFFNQPQRPSQFSCACNPSSCFPPKHNNSSLLRGLWV